MLRFFRQIRKQLMEQNKVRSYFFYAIGEIALVMIGILLALQVNNWNENNKKNDLKREYTMSLISDLQLDMQNIEGMRAYNAEQLKALDTLAVYIEEHVKDVSDLRALNFVANLSMLSDLNNSTYQALISSGSIDLYRKEIRDVLISHQSVQEDYLQSYENNTRVFYDTMNAYLQSAPIYPTPWIPDQLREKTWEELDKTRYITSFDALLLQRRFLLNVFENQYVELEESTQQLITLLEKEIS